MIDKIVIIYIGTPGCGKSTHALKAKARLDCAGSSTIILERDIIRSTLDPKYYLKKPNKQFESRVTEIQRKTIKEFLFDEENDYLLIADTNLNKELRDSLVDFIYQTSPGSNCLVRFEEMEEGLDLNLCLKRNQLRKEVVPDEVVIKYWKRQVGMSFTNSLKYSRGKLYSPQKDTIFVGDLHSQYDKLQRLLQNYGMEAQYVFLGDINDSRLTNPHQGVSFLKTYQLVRCLVDEYNSVLIHSNHQKNLIRAIRGQRKKATWGMKDTLRELQELNLITVQYGEDGISIASLEASQEAIDMANWLDARPYYYEGHLGSFRGVHAQFLESECFNPYDVTGKGLSALVYGTTTEDRERINWWKTYEGKSFIVAGHYHEAFESKHCAVIDGGCGNDGGKLLTYIVEGNGVD